MGGTYFLDTNVPELYLHGLALVDLQGDTSSACYGRIRLNIVNQLDTVNG